MKRMACPAFVLVSLVALAGCDRSADYAGEGSKTASSPAVNMAPAAGGSEARASVPAMAMGGAIAPQSGGGGRMGQMMKGPNGEAGGGPRLELIADSQPDGYLIRNATVTVEVKDVRKAEEALTNDVRQEGGYMAGMHESVDALGARQVELQVRVPYTRLNGTLDTLDGLGRVLDRQVDAEDVTEEYVDSSSTLRNLQRTEERLLAHLSQTGRLADTLLVEKELNRVRQEIERLQGRLRYLGHRVAFSTITATLKEAARAQAITPPEHYSAGRVFTDATRSLVEFGNGLLSAVIWLAVWAVVWLPPLLALVYVVRWDLRRHRKPGMLAANERK